MFGKKSLQLAVLVKNYLFVGKHEHRVRNRGQRRLPEDEKVGNLLPVHPRAHRGGHKEGNQ